VAFRCSILAALCVALLAAPASARTAPRCHTSDLRGHFGTLQGAAGSRFGPLVLVNASSHTCTVYGFIGGQLLGAGGRPLTTHVVRDPTTPVRTITVRPGAKAVSTVRWSAIPSGSGACPTPAILEVTPPDETTQLRVRWPAHQQICGAGTIEVRALRQPYKG
jgi:Protein of unknown function (DUF4232)